MLDIVESPGTIITPPADLSTVFYTAIAAYALSSGRVICILNGQAIYFNPMSIDQFGLTLGLTKTSAIPGGSVEVQLSGIFYEAGLGLISGVNYFVGLNGTLVNNPTGLKVVQPFGFAINTDTLNININSPIETL